MLARRMTGLPVYNCMCSIAFRHEIVAGAGEVADKSPQGASCGNAPACGMAFTWFYFCTCCSNLAIHTPSPAQVLPATVRLIAYLCTCRRFCRSLTMMKRSTISGIATKTCHLQHAFTSELTHENCTRMWQRSNTTDAWQYLCACCSDMAGYLFASCPMIQTQSMIFSCNDLQGIHSNQHECRPRHHSAAVLHVLVVS